MDDVTIIRALHVLSVVLWIGGVGFVTTVLLPAARKLTSSQARTEFIAEAERRFARQARFMIALAGLTGLYMLVRLDLWERFQAPAYWWLDAMVGVWLLFALMLYVVEPLLIHRWLERQTWAGPEAKFGVIIWLHRILLAISLITLLGAVAGSHGLLIPV